MVTWEIESTPGTDDLARTGRKDRTVGPHAEALPVRLCRDRGYRAAGKVRVDLDRFSVGSLRHRHGEGQVGLVGDRLHPGHQARRLALRHLPCPRVVEEARPGHQGRVADVRTGNLADQGRPGQVTDLAQVVGHDPDRRDAAVGEPAQGRLGRWPVRRRGDVLMRVDQARDDELASAVNDLRAGAQLGRDLGVRSHQANLRAVDDDGHRRPRPALRSRRSVSPGGRS